jgi:regulator of sigma E protease
MDDFWIEVARYAQVVLGISLVIFVHEAGHFVCARLCGVRVEVFSLGMGPRLLGWRRGPTLYQIALVPIGGYVRMAGEDSVESRASPAPDELHGKSVGRRFLIYSGGVLANVAFGLVLFPIIFAVGVPCVEPVLGPSLPGTPAWHAGLQRGTRVLRVNDHDVFDFSHVLTEVALGSPEETVLEVLDPGAKTPRTVRLTPVWSEEIGAYKIGVNSALDPTGAVRVAPDSPAARAGLATGDRLLSIESPLPDLPIEDQLALAWRDGAPLVATFEHAGVPKKVEIVPRDSESSEDHKLGIMPVIDHLFDLKETPLVQRSGLRKGDVLLTVAGRPVLRDYDFALALRSGHRGQAVPVELERDGSKLALSIGPLTEDELRELPSDLAIGPNNGGTHVTVKPGTAAERAGLKDGDRVLSIDGRKMDNYKPVLEAAKSARDGRTLAIAVERTAPSGETTYLTLHAAVGELRWAEYGFAPQPDVYTYRTRGPIEAVSAGIGASWKFLEESWLTLKRILLGQVSGQNIGGIITIGVVSHSWASVGLAKLFFFLCMLSMNLAFLNVLPIPVFDGGHLFFLLIEKIKGSPVSERVLGYSQMVGIVLIVSLMVYVTYNDVMKWVMHR